MPTTRWLKTRRYAELHGGLQQDNSAGTAWVDRGVDRDTRHRCRGDGPAAADDPPPLKQIATIVADIAIDEPYPVRVRGVVTWRRNRGLISSSRKQASGFDAHRTPQAGHWQGDEAVLQSIRPGMEVEVEGLASRGGYTPTF